MIPKRCRMACKNQGVGVMAKGRILVIDDEKDLIELVRYNLEKEGFVVQSAQDGESGYRRQKRNCPT